MFNGVCYPELLPCYDRGSTYDIDGNWTKYNEYHNKLFIEEDEDPLTHLLKQNRAIKLINHLREQNIKH